MKRKKDPVFGVEALAPIGEAKLKPEPKARGKRGIIAIKRTEHYRERMRYVLGESEE